MLGKAGWGVYSATTAFPIIHANTKEAAQALSDLCQEALGVSCHIERTAILSEENIRSIKQYGLTDVTLLYNKAGLAVSTRQSENIAQALMTASTRKRTHIMITPHALIVHVRDFVMKDKSRMITLAHEIWEKHPAYDTLIDIMMDWRFASDSGASTSFLDTVRESPKIFGNPVVCEALTKEKLKNRVQQAVTIML